MGIFHWLESKCQLGAWLLHDTTHAFLSPLFFIMGSCFQNVQGLSVFKVNFLSLRKKYSGTFIILWEASHASHYHFTWCDLFVFNQTSIGHFSFIYFSKISQLLCAIVHRLHALVYNHWTILSLTCGYKSDSFIAMSRLCVATFCYQNMSVLIRKKLFQKVGSVYTLA